MNTQDIYIPCSAHALPSLPGEHIEAVELDVGTQDGRVVIIHGRVSVFEATRVIFVEIPTSVSAIDRDAASSMLQHAVRNRLVRMSDALLSAVERGFIVRGYGRGEVAA